MRPNTDTHLARRLHARGRLPLADLLGHLERVKAARAQDPEASLAAALVHAGLLTPEEVAGYAAELEEPAAPAPTPQPLTRWEPGGRVGDYLLGECLGRGGMGVVFRARHIASGRDVALKGVPCQGSPTELARFQREASSQARVDAHPNVIRIHDAGLAGTGGYLAMEWATGGDLSALLSRRGTLRQVEAAELVAQLARGLAHVHAHGILHRDLKPANVLFGADGTPKLVDFGLARLAGDSRITLTGELIGTPAYMAPEQALAMHEDVDVRTDVYGLGVLLYEVLTGNLPHQATGMVEILVQVINDAPPRPSTGRPDLDPTLEAVCLKAMAKDREARYPDAVSLAEALEGWVRDQATDVHPPARGAQALAGPALLAATAALAFAAGFVARGAGPAVTSSEAVSPHPSAADLAAPDLAAAGSAPAGLALDWTLGAPPLVIHPALWEQVGVVADPLGGARRSGWLEQAFLGAARHLSDGRLEVDYAPRRGLRLRADLGLGVFAHGEEDALGFEQAAGGFSVRAPNDAGVTTLSLGSSRWERPALALTCRQRPLDQGGLTLQLPTGGVRISAREGALLAGSTRLPFEWGDAARTIELIPSASDPVRVDGAAQEGLDVLAERADALRSAEVSLSEGEWTFSACRVSGSCLRPDRAALCWAPTPAGPHAGARLRFEGRPSSGGGPLLVLGRPGDGDGVAAELVGSSFVLRVGSRLLRSVSVPPLAAGSLTLIRRGDQLSALLEGEGVQEALEAELPERLPGELHLGYGSSGPRIRCKAVTVWRGEDDAERAAYDAEGDVEAGESPRSLWWEGVERVRPLLDPVQARGLGLIGAPEARVERARQALRALSAAADGLVRASAQRDARCRALVAAVLAGDVEGARAQAAVLASDAPSARVTLEGLSGGLLLRFARGFQAGPADPRVAEAALWAAEPLVDTDAERTHLHLSWASHLNRLAPEATRPPSAEQRAHFDRVLRHLRVAEETASGPLELYRVHDQLARAYDQVGLTDDWEHHMRQVLLNPIGGGYPNNWARFGQALAGRGRAREAIEALLGAAVRDRGRARRRSVILEALQRARPDASTAAVALYGVAALEAGDGWLTHPAGKQALSAVQATLQASQLDMQALDLRAFDLARYVVLRAGGEVEAPAAPQRPTEWLLTPDPDPSDLAQAARDDLLVGTLVRLDPRLSALLSAR